MFSELYMYRYIIHMYMYNCACSAGYICTHVAHITVGALVYVCMMYVCVDREKAMEEVRKLKEEEERLEAERQRKEEELR